MQKKQSLKKFFLLLIAWFITIVAVIGGSILYDQNKSSEYDEAATVYIKKVVPEISKWAPEITRALMAPEIAATIPDENFIQAMEWFSRLGALQSMEAPKLEGLHKDHETEIGKRTVIEYSIKARYDNDEAEINLKLLVKNASFEIYRFNFSSEVLSE